MGLSSMSTGNKILEADIFEKTIGCDYTISLAGNPNVGKSTVFNALTGMHQHTGNWPGKTVSNAMGKCSYKDKNLLFVDIPGTYSLMSNSEEEQIARNYICFGNADVTVVVIDATSIERNLNLVYQTFEITKNVIVCVNLMDEAKKKGIEIDLEKLSSLLGVPVVGTIASKKKTLVNLLDSIIDVVEGKIKPNPIKVTYDSKIEHASKLIEEQIDEINDTYINKWLALKLLEDDEEILNSIYDHLEVNLKEKVNLKEANEYLKENDIDSDKYRDILVSGILSQSEKVKNDVCKYKNRDYNEKDRKIDRILTSKVTGIPIMLAFLACIFYITIVGANYPSKLLSEFFGFIQSKLYIIFDYIHAPVFIKGVLIDGMYQTLAWVISVMLPPMAIFFPLFTVLEDLGYLPRIAFNLDNLFKKASASGKQALTMCMGFGCNAAGVIGCRIINSPRERLIAILTNAFVPCNGRFPFLITIASIFIGGIGVTFKAGLISTLAVIGIVVLGIFLTLIISKILSKTVLKGMPSTFTLELPPFRKPQVGRILVRSIVDRTLFVLGRAIAVAAPAGIAIWLLANIHINAISLLTYLANFFDPFAKLMGLDGYILTAFILGIPANEIVLPIILMSYLGSSTMVDLGSKVAIGNILINNGWTILTAINVMIFTLLHFPCSTTLLTIKKETKSVKWMMLAFALPTVVGILICMFNTFVFNLIF